MRSILRLTAVLLAGLIAAAALGTVAQPATAEERPVEASVEIVRVGDRGATVAVSMDGGGTRYFTAEVPPPPQAGPWSQSTTTNYTVCFWVSFPGGGGYSVCLEITITVSTTIPNADEPTPDQLASAGNTEPAKVCWTERLRNGETATHCVEVTIAVTTGSGTP